MSTASPAIRLAPIRFVELPSHPSFDNANSRPELLPFALTLLDQGHALVQPKEFNLRFSHHSEKSSPPSNNEVEILSTSVPGSDLQQLPWDSPSLPRSKPSQLSDEHWYARRSYHHNLSVKHNPGTASWQEFIYGLRDQHSKHEFDFTPTIFDARLICEWNDTLNEGLTGSTYSSATMSIYEMCHDLPGPVSSRCFPVLVLTASVSNTEFIAVTVPVDISDFAGAFYSNGRNKHEGHGDTKKSVTLGQYCAVERVHRYSKQTTHQGRDGHVHSHGDDGEEIEWVMATASHTRGSIPMTFQRMGVPGGVAKDVGLFLKWIRKVSDEDIAAQKVGTSTAHPD